MNRIIYGNNYDSIERLLGTLNIDYLQLYKQNFIDNKVVFIICLVLWILLLIDLLSETSSKYFSSSLTLISVKLKLSDSFAGVTLIALANGGPDIFSSFSGLTNGTESLSISALLG